MGHGFAQKPRRTGSCCRRRGFDCLPRWTLRNPERAPGLWRVAQARKRATDGCQSSRFGTTDSVRLRNLSKQEKRTAARQVERQGGVRIPVLPYKRSDCCLSWRLAFVGADQRLL